jgi:YbbR domain-containing protein
MLQRVRELLAGRFTRADLSRLVASLVLATLLWGWVSLITDPEVTRSFSDLPLQYEPLGGDLLIVTELPTIDVRLTGPESVIDDISRDEIVVSIPTDQIDKPDDYRLTVRIDTPDGVRKRQASPAQIPLTVERSVAETFPLHYLLEELPPDDPRQVGAFQPAEESAVTVSGPESVVERVEEVVLRIEIGSRTRDFESEFTPAALDANGNDVPEVTIAPSQIRGTVPISQRGQPVAVFTRLQGVPAEGYEVVDRTIVPATVRVDGPQEVLDRLLTISTEPVDISGRTETFNQQVALDLSTLPPGVTVIDPASGLVEVVVQISQRGVTQTLPAQPVMVIGRGAGLSVSSEPESVAVVVFAAQEQIAALSAGDIVVTVDVTGLGPGTYELTPVVAIPPSMRWIRTEPVEVQVTIAASEPDAATPAPPDGDRAGGTPSSLAPPGVRRSAANRRRVRSRSIRRR